MSDPSSQEICTTIANFRAIERACKKLGVSVAELETELVCEKSSPSLEEVAAQSAVCRILNLRNLEQAALKTNMPVPVYLNLQRSINTIGALETSHRAPRIYSSEEWAERGRGSRQSSLFDEPETSPKSANQNVFDDGGNYPFG